MPPWPSPRGRASAPRKLPTDTNFKISSCPSSLFLSLSPPPSARSCALKQYARTLRLRRFHRKGSVNPESSSLQLSSKLSRANGKFIFHRNTNPSPKRQITILGESRLASRRGMSMFHYARREVATTAATLSKERRRESRTSSASENFARGENHKRAGGISRCCVKSNF